ncbi:MAG TPA: glycosyltransferase family A protein [Bradyrhizobium sp.]|nr:glycosyltransferase family A protein [Bradyrhizobium sp.]
MSDPLVTVGVPVYQGQDELPVTLECLRTQSYANLDILISVDAGDQPSAAACEPFLRRDSRFRMQIQSSRLGWAGNTDWTMRARRGAFYIFQQHDDQVSPTYIADLVEAASRYPDAAICYAEVQSSGIISQTMRGVPLLGDPVQRVLTCLKYMDHTPFRGLIRSAALARTSGLLLSDFDPLDSYGTEMRFLMELALLGEFRFVSGPVYYKRLHGKNLYLKREKWSEQQKQRAWACLAAWVIEVVVPAGPDHEQRRLMFDMVLNRFLVPSNPWRWLRDPVRRLARSKSGALRPARAVIDWLKSKDPLARAVSDRWMLYEASDPERRATFLRIVFDRLKAAGRFKPATLLNSTWEMLQDQADERFVGARRSRQHRH